MLDDSTDSDSGIDEGDMFILKEGKEEFRPVAANLGLFYKVRKLKIVFSFIEILISHARALSKAYYFDVAVSK